jgi:hypothetical protein
MDLVTVRVWLKAFYTELPYAWHNPERYDVNNKPIPCSWTQLILSPGGGHNLQEDVVMWLDHHLLNCEECWRFGRGIVGNP